MTTITRRTIAAALIVGVAVATVTAVAAVLLEPWTSAAVADFLAWVTRLLS